MFTEENKKGIVYTRSSLIRATHAFSTRIGGYSSGDFSSMNFGSDRGDKAENVSRNYELWCREIFDVSADDACVTRQVHGNTVKTVSAEDRHRCMEAVPYDADGLVTAEKGLPIFCFTADCVPALLWDSEEHSAAAVHCGWKSSVADILKNTVSAMVALGTRTGQIHAALGPAIGKCCFETHSDVTDALAIYLDGDTEGLWDALPNGKYKVDLRMANARRLIQLGLRPENIDVSQECTCCLPEKYWSARYCAHNGFQRGSMCAGIML